MYELISKIKPYFHSLREIENNVSLDIKLPISWQYEDILKKYKTVKYKIQDKNNNLTLLSIISVSSEEGYNSVFETALDIIVFNREEEEKQRLFKQKVRELEELFKQESLDKLKHFFQTHTIDTDKNNDIKNGLEQGGTESLELVGQGDQERSGTDFIGKEEND